MRIKHHIKIYTAMKNIKVNLAIFMILFFINCAPLMAQQTSVNRSMDVDYGVLNSTYRSGAIFDNNDGFIMADNTLHSGKKLSATINEYYSNYIGISIQDDQIKADIPSGKAEAKKHGADNGNNIIVTSVNKSGNDKNRTTCQSDENEPMKWRRTYLWSR